MTTTTAMMSPHGMPASVNSHSWPRIALVTPVFNSGEHIEATIRSVLAQDYPNLDYFIVDGGSTDGTVDIIRKYEGQISGWISEPDNGMYDALNKGFARTTGEIMGWISGTDFLYPGGLKVVGSVFRDLPEVEWITGPTTVCAEDGVTEIFGTPHWSRYRFLMGANRYIQQESTFWRRSLWEKAGGYVDASRTLVSDFELWVRFFRHAQLYPVGGLIGCTRSHGDSLGAQFLEECYRIHDEIIETEVRNPMLANRLVKLFRDISRGMEGIPGVHWLWDWTVLRPLQWMLYRVPGPDWAPKIVYTWSDRPYWRLRRPVPELWQDIIVRSFWIRRRLGLRRQTLQKICGRKRG